MNLLTATPGRRARLVRRRRRTRPGTPAGPRFGPTGQFRLSARCGHEPLTSRSGALTRRGPVRRSTGAFRPARRRESRMGAFRPPSSLSSRKLPHLRPEATNSGWPADPALRDSHCFRPELEFSPVLASTDPADLSSPRLGTMNEVRTRTARAPISGAHRHSFIYAPSWRYFQEKSCVFAEVPASQPETTVRKRPRPEDRTFPELS